MDIYVGSIPFKMKEAELRTIFEKYGAVHNVKIIIDKKTRQNKGFAFVEMANDQDGYDAISELDGTELMGRKIIVSKAEGKGEKK